MAKKDIADYLYTWNPAPPPHVGSVTIDDDTLRDGLQGAFALRISPEQAAEILRLTDAVGVRYSILGFPSSSTDELTRCRQLLDVIHTEKLGIVPGLLARTHVNDVNALIELNGECATPFLAELFIGTSPIRRQVEGWSLAEVLQRTRGTCERLVKAGIRVGLSIEDATRTPPDELREFFELGVDVGLERISICDTVGDSLPDGARRITAAGREFLDKRHAMCGLAWHGHNDKGCALANSLAAVEAGANIVSGTFLGLGERAGNTPLEQVIAYLYQAGSRNFRVDLLPSLVARLSEFTGYAISPTAPLVGMQAFATTAGVHSAALLKARKLGRDFEDYIYSAVPATAFGRSQAVLLGPTSGMANARNAIELSGHSPDEALAKRLLSHAKTLARWMSPEEVHHYLNQQLRQPEQLQERP